MAAAEREQLHGRVEIIGLLGGGDDAGVEVDVEADLPGCGVVVGWVGEGGLGGDWIFGC